MLKFGKKEGRKTVVRTIPQDPVLCVSFLNTQLRNHFSNFDDLCDDFEVDREELEGRMAKAGYFYKQEINQFR